jgi:hypothetical protein
MNKEALLPGYIFYRSPTRLLSRGPVTGSDIALDSRTNASKVNLKRHELSLLSSFSDATNH